MNIRRFYKLEILIMPTLNRLSVEPVIAKTKAGVFLPIVKGNRNVVLRVPFCIFKKRFGFFQA